LGNQVAVVEKGARGVVSIDLKKLNYGAAKTAIDAYMSKVGGGGSNNGPRFPGQPVQFKSGVWKFGMKAAQKNLKAGQSFVFNAPNMAAAWVMWRDTESGKRYPEYTALCFPFAGDDLASRESLGDNDPSEWELDDQDNPQDPWKPVLIYPIRDEDGDTVNHVMLSTKSACIAGFRLFSDLLEEMKLRPGQLPVITLGSAKAEMERTVTDKKGKEKKVKNVWDVPTFEITGWVSATDADNSGLAGIDVTADGDNADIGEVSVRSRSENVKKQEVEEAKRALPGKSPATKQRRRIVDEDEDTETL